MYINIPNSFHEYKYSIIRYVTIFEDKGITQSFEDAKLMFLHALKWKKYI